MLAGGGAERERLAGQRNGGAGVGGDAGGRDGPGRGGGLAKFLLESLLGLSC